MAITKKEGAEASAFIYGRYVADEAVSLTTTFQNVLLIDARKIRQSVITFNNTGTDALNYQIYATSKYNPSILEHIEDPMNTFVDKTNSDWVNLLSIIAGETGTTYTHTFSKVLNSGLRFYESFTNEWFAVLVTAQADTSTTDLEIWHRGQS